MDDITNNIKNEKEFLKAGRFSLSSIRLLFILIITIFLIIVSVSFVSAYNLLCLTHGQSIPSDENPVYTCTHDVCQICVTETFFPTHPGRCNGISACQTFGNGSGIDQDPPNLTINSPVDGEAYDSRRVLFDIETDDRSSYYYIDNNNGRGRWRRLASYTQSYSRFLSFRDGLNDITIKAVDVNGNEAFESLNFYVDSRDPRIGRTNPRRGFANGFFDVEFREANPDRLVFHYGRNNDFREVELDIDNDCRLDRSKYICDVHVSLDVYDGHTISYWFELEDISGNTHSNKPVNLGVDITDPVIVNSDWWSQGTERNNRYIYFDMLINEQNFDEVTFIDNEDRRPREKRVCSRLRDDKCVKKVSFRKGHHELDLMVIDEAGNAISERIEFDVV